MKTMLGAVLLAAFLGGSTLAEEAPQDPPKPPTDKTDIAIGKAIDFLVSCQDKDGAITEGNHNHTAMTSLAIMAMAATGHQPSDDTKQGIAMKKALSYVLRPDR